VFQVGVTVTPRVGLKSIEITTYITKGAPFFSGKPTLKNFTVKRAYWGAILG